MNVYESLENLQVSEECFNDIMGIVEDILSEDVVSQIEKVHGKPRFLKGKTYKYWSKPLHGQSVSKELSVPAKTSKSAHLIDKVNKARHDEEEQANIRGEFDTDYANQASLNRTYTKNLEGEEATQKRRYKPVPNEPNLVMRKTTGPRQRFGADVKRGTTDSAIKSQARNLEKVIKRTKSPNLKPVLRSFARQNYEKQKEL